MMRSDYHMHSEFSSDSEAPMEAMIESAIKKGLTRICFTDHMDYKYPKISPDRKDPSKFQDFLFDANAYCKKISILKVKYQDQIEVMTGVELGLQKSVVSEVSDLMKKHNFDFVIGSSHLLYGTDPYLKSFWDDLRIKSTGTTSTNADLDRMLVKKVIRDYFEDILINIDLFPWFQVYGHLDYIVRYAPGQETYYDVTDYFDVLEAILQKLIASGRGIEINSGALRRGMQQANPHIKILQLYRELGGEIITVGADAHEPSLIAYRFDWIRGVLLQCGYEYYTTFKNKHPEFHSLNL